MKNIQKLDYLLDIKLKKLKLIYTEWQFILWLSVKMMTI